MPALAPFPRRLIFLLGERALLGLATSGAPVALTFTVLDVLHAPRDLGYVLAAEAVGLLLGLAMMGSLADRFSPRTELLVADVVFGGAMGVLAIAGFAQVRLLVWYLLPSLASGISTAVLVPSLQALIARAVAAEARQSVNAVRSITRSLASIAGPALAGVVVVAASPEWALVAGGILGVVGAAMLVGVPDPGRTQSEARGIVAELVSGWRAYWGFSWLVAVDGQFALWFLAVYGPLMVLGPVLSVRHFGGPAAWAGMLVAVAIGGALGGALGLRVRTRRPLVLGLGVFAVTAGWLAALAVLAPLWVEWLLAALAGLGLELFMLLWDTVFQTHVPPEVLGKLSAYDYLASAFPLPIGYAIAVPLAGVLGIQGVFLLGVGVTLVGVVGALGVPSVRRLRPQPSGEATSTA